MARTTDPHLFRAEVEQWGRWNTSALPAVWLVLCDLRLSDNTFRAVPAGSLNEAVRLYSECNAVCIAYEGQLIELEDL